MSNERNNKILDELSKPFHPSHITWRPGALTGKKDKALALAYADVRAYQNRLDEVCGMDWSVSYTPWGDRIICHVTINGITRSSTGEPDSDSERQETAGTSTEAQAYKRACAMFGLGRYLYNMPSLWVEYDADSQRFTEKAKARLNGIIAQHYQRFLDNQPEVALATDEQPAEDMPAETAKPAEATKTVERPCLAILDKLGVQLYGDQWPTVKVHNIKRLVGEDGTVDTCTDAQIQTLINGLNTLKKSRQS